MQRNQNVYNAVPARFRLSLFLESRLGCPCVARVTSSEELGTMSKNSLRGITVFTRISAALD